MNVLWPAAIAGCILISPGCGRSGPPAKRHSNVRILESSCASALPALIRVIERGGFRLVAKDDSGRIASFMWMGTQLPPVLETAYDHQNLAMGPDGSSWMSSLKLESAVLTLSPQGRGCEAKVTVSYQGENGLWGGRWSRIESTGLLENRFLSTFRLKSPARPPRTAIANGNAAGPEPTRTAHRLPSTPPASIIPESRPLAVYEGH